MAVLFCVCSEGREGCDEKCDKFTGKVKPDHTANHPAWPKHQYPSLSRETIE